MIDVNVFNTIKQFKKDIKFNMKHLFHIIKK
jgi:hypothetical protein